MEISKCLSKVAPVPKGFKTVTPCFTVRGVAEAIEFYVAAFGAKEHKRVRSVDGSWIPHAEVKIGTSVVILTEEQPAYGLLAPTSLGGSATRGHLYVRNVDTFIERAVEHGAVELAATADTYWGDRMATIVDPFGHVWTVASRVENLTEEEIEERASAGLEVAAGSGRTARTRCLIKPGSNTVCTQEPLRRSLSRHCAAGRFPPSSCSNMPFTVPSLSPAR